MSPTWRLPAVLLGAAWLALAAALPGRATGPAVRHLELELGAEVAPSAGASSVRLWVPLPPTAEAQQVDALSVESPQRYEIHTLAHGNRCLYLESRGDPVRVEVRSRVRRLEQRGGASPEEPAGRWLQPDRFVPRGEPFRTLAREATAGIADPLSRARALYDYVTGSMVYDKSGAGWGRGDAVFACDIRRGNCTDFHSLLIALCREVGIPARFAIGFPVPRQDGGELNGYHCWAEIYVEGQGWIPVDSSEAFKNPARKDYYFGSLDPDRVLFTIGRDFVLEPPQAGPPLNYWVYPYAEVDGREVPVAFSLRYASRDE